MDTIAPAIKRRRVQLGLTQREMADKIHLSEKAWQNIENGITKLDIDRLNEIATVLEMSLMDLINSQESFYINQLSNEHSQVGVGFLAKDVVINNDVSEKERALFEKMLAEKDRQIEDMRKDMDAMRTILEKIAAKL